MRAQAFVNRIFRILQVGQLSRAGGASLAARRRQPLSDAVIAQRALLRRVRLRIEEAAPVGARLDAITAAQAVVLVHQHNSIRCSKGRSDWTHLRARRIRTVIAKLRNEEVLAAVVGMW